MIRHTAVAWSATGPTSRFIRLVARAAHTGASKILAGTILILVVPPLVALLVRAFGGDDGIMSLDPLRELARQPSVLKVFRDTTLVISISVTAATIMGSLLAWLNERTDARMGWVTDLMPIVPLLVPPIAGAIGWVFLAAPVAGYLNVAIRAALSLVGVTLERGPLNIYSWYGLIFVFTLYLVPYTYLVVSSALQRLDGSLEEAARVSGSGVWRTFRDVTLPAVGPAVSAGALLAGIFALAFFSVPAIIGTAAGIDVLAVRVVQLMRGFPANIEAAVGFGLVLVAVIGLFSLLQGRAIRKGNFATMGGRAATSTKVVLGRWRILIRAGVLLYFLITTMLPFGALVLVSTQGFWSPNIDWSGATFITYRDIFLRDRLTLLSLQHSLYLALAGSTLVVLASGFLVSRNRRTGARIEALANGAMKIPGAVSNILIGVAFIATFAGPPFRLHGSLLILLMAYIVVNMPQASLTASAAYSQIGTSLIEASRIAGVTEGGTFRKISFPLMLPGLAAGWAMAFVIMVGDLTVSSMLAGPRRPVVGFQILALWEGSSHPRLATLAVVLSVLSSVVVLAVLQFVRWASSRRTQRVARPGAVAAL